MSVLISALTTPAAALNDINESSGQLTFFNDNRKEEQPIFEYRELFDFSDCFIHKNNKPLELLPLFQNNYEMSNTYKTSIFYKNLTNIKMQDTRTNIVNIAKSQLGYIEGNSNSNLSGEKEGRYNRTEYGYWYGMQDEWCAMFVSWCANLAGDTNVPKHALCSAGLKNFMKNGLAHSRDEIKNGHYIPQPGDIVYFKDTSRDNSVLTTHVGIVIEYKNGILYTIEGNTLPNDKSISCGGIVEEKQRSINSNYVVYVCESV